MWSESIYMEREREREREKEAGGERERERVCTTPCQVTPPHMRRRIHGALYEEEDT